MNEVYQLLYQLFIRKGTIVDVDHILEVGLSSDSIDAEGNCIVLKVMYSDNYFNILSKISKSIIKYTPINVRYMLILCSIECPVEYVDAYNNIVKGKFSKVDKELFEKIIAPSIGSNRKDWSHVFNRSIEAAVSYIKSRIDIDISEEALVDLGNILLEGRHEFHVPLYKDKYKINK